MSKEKRFYITFSVLLSLTAVVTLAIGLFGYLTLSQKQADIAESEYYTEKLAEKKQILESLESKYATSKDELPLIDIALPADKDSSKLLADFNALASESKLKLTFLEPGSVTSSNKDSKKSTSDLSLLQTVKGSTGYELPLDIGVSGSYTNFLGFVRRVENYQRLINIESLEIKKQDNESVPDYIEARLKIRAYIKK